MCYHLIQTGEPNLTKFCMKLESVLEKVTSCFKSWWHIHRLRPTSGTNTNVLGAILIISWVHGYVKNRLWRFGCFCVSQFTRYKHSFFRLAFIELMWQQRLLKVFFLLLKCCQYVDSIGTIKALSSNVLNTITRPPSKLRKNSLNLA